MKKIWIGALAVAALAACRRPMARGEASEVVALVVRTEPAGASVRVGKIDRAWVSPCEIAHPSIRRGMLDVSASLEGYETATRRVPYDGHVPTFVELKLAARPRPGARPPEVARPAEPAQAPPAAASGQGQIVVTGSGDRVRVTSSGRVVAETIARAGEIVKLSVPRETVKVEFIDDRGRVTRSVETMPEAPPAPPAPPAPDTERVGQVQLVHRSYGVFVRLDPGLQLQPGEEIVIVRDGREVARTKILQVTSADERYPAGAAQVAAQGASVRKGDEARRGK
jgi:hypothetical protein